MTLTELRARQATLVTEARERLNQISAATDAARATELETQHDAAMSEYDRLTRQITNEERQTTIERTLEEARSRQRPTRDVTGRATDEPVDTNYRDAFYAMLRAGGDLGELSTEQRGALRAGVQRGTEFRAQTAGTTTAGGFTVPVELANVLIRSMALWGPMYDEDICTTLNTASGNQINLPTIDDTTVPVVKHTEGVALTDDGGSDATFGQKRLDAYVFDTEFVRFSLELAQDSIFNIEQLLGSLLGERLGRRANVELTTGDGSGDPNGIVTASSLGKTAAGAAAVTYDELIDLVHSVDPAYRQSPKVRFMLNDLTLAKIRKLKDGEGRYIWTAGDVVDGVPARLLGYNFSINQAMPAMTTGLKPIIFGDLGKYFVRKVGSPVIGVMRERFWPDLGIAGLVRLDGELGDTAAVKHLIQA